MVVLTADRKRRLAIFMATIALICVLYWWHRDPVPHANNAAKRWVTITIDTSGLPVPADTAKVIVQYEIENTSCLKPLFPSGASRTFTHRIDVATTRTTPQSFQSVVALDPYKDEDYDGLGKCRWGLSIVSVKMTVGHRHVEASVAGSIVEGFETTERFFSARTFEPSDDRDPVIGRGLTPVQKSAPNEEIYRITISAKEAADD
jgi:hypothetical protein